MGLLDEAKAESTPQLGPRCSVQVIAAQLEPDEATELHEALGLIPAGAITGSALERVLRKRGFVVKAATLRRHAKGECSCGAD